MKTRKLLVFTIIFLVVLIFLALTNPNERDYYNFTVSEYGEPPHDSLHFSKVERINFIVFSTYTPYFLLENGITHIGIIGRFFQISEGQFDYPWWLELFNKRMLKLI